MCLRCPQCGTATTKEVDRTQFLLDIIIWAWPHPCLCWALISLSRISLPSPPLSSYHFIIQLRLGLPGKITNSVLLWFLKDFHSTWSKRKTELEKKKKTAWNSTETNTTICSALWSIPVYEKCSCTALYRTSSTVGKAVVFECCWKKSLIIFGISSGERYGCIFVFQSIWQSMSRCCKLQAPGLWKSRRSPMKLSQTMSTVLPASHKPEAHHCHPVMKSGGC